MIARQDEVDVAGLWRATLRGDGASMHRLHRELTPKLVMVAHGVLRDRDDAEDAAQRGWCRLFGLDRRRRRAIAEVEGWLVVAVRREALAILREGERRGRREVVAARGAHARGGDSDGVTGGVAEGGGHDEIGRLVDGLPSAEREVVVLRHCAGLSFAQISAATGVAKSTLSDAYQRGVARIRDGVKDLSAMSAEGGGDG